jgi:hypothetical protein
MMAGAQPYEDTDKQGVVTLKDDADLPVQHPHLHTVNQGQQGLDDNRDSLLEVVTTTTPTIMLVKHTSTPR